MATAYVIWDRTSRAFIGGAQPLVYDQSADATLQIATKQKQQDRVADSHRFPKPLYDVVTVTV
jgi:hypothetical protein